MVFRTHVISLRRRTDGSCRRQTLGGEGVAVVAVAAPIAATVFSALRRVIDFWVACDMTCPTANPSSTLDFVDHSAENASCAASPML